MAHPCSRWIWLAGLIVVACELNPQPDIPSARSSRNDDGAGVTGGSTAIDVPGTGDSSGRSDAGTQGEATADAGGPPSSGGASQTPGTDAGGHGGGSAGASGADAAGASGAGAAGAGNGGGAGASGAAGASGSAGAAGSGGNAGDSVSDNP